MMRGHYTHREAVSVLRFQLCPGRHCAESPVRYIVLGVNPQENVDVDTLPYIDIPEGVTRIYLGEGLKWGEVRVKDD